VAGRGASEHLIRLDLESGSWKTHARPSGRFVTSGTAYDATTGKLFVGAQTSLISYDTRAGAASRLYEGNEKPAENLLFGGWRNRDGTISFVTESPGLCVLKWDPVSEAIEWRRLTDDPAHPEVSLGRQSITSDDGAFYLPGFGWFQGIDPCDSRPHPDREACWFGRSGSLAFGLVPNPSSLSGEVVSWDFETGEVSTICSTPDTTVMNIALTGSDKILVVDIYGNFRRYDAASGELEISRSLDSAHEHTSRTLIPVDADRVIGTPFICQNFWVHDTRVNKSQYGGRAAGSAGQVDDVLCLDGLIYFAAYGRGQLTVYDPDQPSGYPENPRPLAEHEQGNHGCGMTMDGRVIWASFKPKYGTLDGLVIRYDSEAKTTAYHVGSLAGQHLLHPFYDRASGKLISGSSFISDCESATPTHDRVYAVVLDPVSLEVCGQTESPAAYDAIDNVGPLSDGRWLFKGGMSDLLIYEPGVSKLEPLSRLPGETRAIRSVGTGGCFIVQEQDTFVLWNPLTDDRDVVAECTAGLVNAWWTYPGTVCLDCQRHAAWLQDTRLN
jgi:hypothetical protein